jgi:NitT/TauT family transport system substrate-binding protein
MRLPKVASLLLIAMSLVVSGCSTDAPAPGTDLEATSLKIGTLPVVDAAALYIAQERGFFLDEGLKKVEIQTIQGGVFAIPKLVSGALDVSMVNYVSAVTAQAKHAANLRIVADAYQAKPGTFMLLAAKGSSVKEPADLRGRRIAVVSLAGIATLAVETQLRTAGIPASAVHFAIMGLPEMTAALKTGRVDAALLSEPFITQAQTSIGASQVGDVMSGAMTDFPIAGWACSARFAANHPHTIAAFQRAMSKGQQVAAADRKAVERVLVLNAKLDQAVAATVTIGTYPLTLNLTRLQRVPDVMQDAGYLPGHFDMSAMLDLAAIPGRTQR